MKRIVSYTIVLITVITYWSTVNMRYGKDNWKSFIDSDGKGYYAYLPAVFIYQDLNFGFFKKINDTYFQNRTQDYRNKYKGKYIDKYFCGMAVAMTPFFLLGHAITNLTGEAPDGYSRYYCYSVNLAALFYVIASFILLARLLRLYHISETRIALTLFFFAFATNIFYYIVVEPSMSHPYSLFFITLFFYYAKKWFIQPSSKNILLIGVALGMITLLRPINIMILLLLPFIAGSWVNLLKGIRELWNYKLFLILAALAFGAIVSIQLIIYKIQTGDFLVYSYTHEGFNWTNPQLIKVLFGYRKGLFLYTPLLFIGLLGFVKFYRESKFQFYSLLLFLAILSYVLSAWWCWWYGGSFGMRAFLEFYPIFALLFATSFEVLKTKWFSRAFVVLSFLLLIVCQIQTYQVRYYYIHWGEMSKEQYWRVFLRIDWAIQGTHKQKTDLPVTHD